MTLPESLLGYWYAWGALAPAGGRQAWGTIVADPRYPLIWDANHAEVLENHERVTVEEVRAALLPALLAAGAAAEHHEFWDPPARCPAYEELLARADRVGVDSVMVTRAPPRAESPPGVVVAEVERPDEAFWAFYRGTRAVFGDAELPDEVIDQMDRRDREVLIPAGLRLFAAAVDGRPAGLANLLSLEGVGYIDNVVTLPVFRGRGVATAALTHAVRAGLDGGDREVHLLAEAGGRPERLYGRLGFRTVATVRSLTWPLRPDGLT